MENENMKKNNYKLILLSFLFIAIFSVGFFAGKYQVQCRVCAPEQVNMSLFWEAWNKLSEKYVNPAKLDTQKMIYGAISGMVSSIGDPYTSFFEPAETKSFIEDVSGQFEGIGVEVGIKNNQLQVISPIEGSPAKKAGLKAGDKIIKVDDFLTANLSVEEAVKKIKGKKGTEVTLTISRDGLEKTMEITIRRDVIIVPSLKWELKENNIAYIRIYQFSEKTGIDFSKTANEILRSSTEKIVLDLRGNPGGYLEVAQDIAGWFLEKGQIVAIEDFKNKKERIYLKAEGNSKLLKYPTVILMDQGSASASEILASALADNRKIKLVGETSFGKGSVQELQDLSGKSSLKITIANWLTPKENLITDKGIEPDFKVEVTDKDIELNIDRQLDKAIEILKEMN